MFFFLINFVVNYDRVHFPASQKTIIAGHDESRRSRPRGPGACPRKARCYINSWIYYKPNLGTFRSGLHFWKVRSYAHKSFSRLPSWDIPFPGPLVVGLAGVGSPLLYIRIIPQSFFFLQPLFFLNPFLSKHELQALLFQC